MKDNTYELLWMPSLHNLRTSILQHDLFASASTSKHVHEIAHSSRIGHHLLCHLHYLWVVHQSRQSASATHLFRTSRRVSVQVSQKRRENVDMLAIAGLLPNILLNAAGSKPGMPPALGPSLALLATEESSFFSLARAWSSAVLMVALLGSKSSALVYASTQSLYLPRL